MIREDSILGIDRLATEDIVEHIASEERSDSATEPPVQDDGSFSEEITSVEVGEAERDDEERIWQRRSTAQAASTSSWRRIERGR